MSASEAAGDVQSESGRQTAMANLKIGTILLIAGAVLFLLSDTLFGDSEVAYYSVFLGLIMFPIGVILGLVGGIQLLWAKLKGPPD